MTARLKVCVVGSGWTFTSGISYYTCRLATALSEEYDTSVILMRRLIPRRFYPGRDRVGTKVNDVDYPSQVPVFDGVDWWSIPSAFRAMRFLRNQKPDVVVFQWWTGAVLHNYLLLAWVARLLRIRVVIEFHETQDTGEQRISGVGRYVASVGRLLLSRADGYVVHSAHDEEAVRRAFGISDQPLQVAPHGPYDHHLEQGDKPDRDGAFTVLFFGTIRPYKGLEHLVEAFDQLEPDEANEMRLVIAGETWEGWTGPLTAVERSPHRDRVTVVNRYVTDAEVTAFFDDADAVALPYTRSSASGPLHIAMAHGLPVVLTDVGGLREGAAGYEGVTWVPPNDPGAILEALRTLPATRGERFADQRSWSDTVSSYARLFKELHICE